MKDEARLWLQYAEENLASAKVLLESALFNPCLQNVQQCVEKALQALLIDKSIKLKRTHSIFELNSILLNNEISIEVTDDACDFLDSIYLPSKYPVGSVLPDFEPDEDFCKYGLSIANSVYEAVKILLN